MKSHLLPTSAMAAVLILVLFAPAIAFSQATNVTITDVSVIAAPNATYTYSSSSGPALQVGKSIVITGMSNAGNNGTFTITALPPTSFTVVNATGVAASGQTGTGIEFNITSGALLTIRDSNNAAVLKIYDSQIHSSTPPNNPTVQVVPINGINGSSCNSADQIPTDAYVLQGGSPTGCDPNDPFEVTDNNTNTTHQASGKADLLGFHIETHYICAGTCGNITGTGPVCNTSGTICANPDSGFITIRNDTGSAFTGTISLTGNSPTPGDPYCPVNGVASDTWTSGLTTSGTGQSVTLALGSQGTKVALSAASFSASNTTYTYTLTSGPTLQMGQTITITGMADGGNNGTFTITALPTSTSFTVANASGVTATESGTGIVIKLADSSNCGGFNQAQTLTLVQNVRQTAFFGKDDYQITTLNSASGDTLDVLPVPVPAGPLGSVNFTAFSNGQFGFGVTPTATSPLRFSATNFNNLACLAYADFSAPGNPVCVELQLTPSGPSGGHYFFTAQTDQNIDKNSLPNGVGGPAFLGQHLVSCPASGFDINIITAFQAPPVTFGDYTRGSDSGTGSCWVMAFDPNATAVPPGSIVSTFAGFAGLIPPPTFNLVNPGSAEPLNFTYSTSSGSPITNLNWCTSANNLEPTCAAGASRPWVSFGTLPFNCSTGLVATGVAETAVSGSSNLQNLGGGSYRFNWKTVKSNALLGTCAVVIVQFDTGLVVFPDDFKYAKQ